MSFSADADLSCTRLGTRFLVDGAGMVSCWQRRYQWAASHSKAQHFDMGPRSHELPAARVQGESPEARHGFIHLEEGGSTEEPQASQSLSDV